MKVSVDLNSDLAALSDHIIKEGDVIDRGGYELRNAVQVPHIFLEGLYENNMPRKSSWHLIKIFDGETWLYQTIIGVPIRGVMNGGGGADVDAGFVACFGETEKSAIDTKHEQLTERLRALEYKGFVTFTIDSSVLQPSVVSVWLGLLSYGHYALFEGLQDKISAWHQNPFRLMESWSIALLVSRYPYPGKSSADKISLHLAKNLQKHVWLFPCDSFKDVVTTSSTRVAVVTAWSKERLGHANGQCLQTIDRLRIPEKQHRTDARRIAVEVLQPLLEHRIISLSSQCQSW